MSISAIVLAAGKSTRMGQPKMLLPWGKTTVLEKVIETIQAAGIENIVVVTNSEIAPRITSRKIQIALNDNGEMLTSIQIGLRSLPPPTNFRSSCPNFRRTSSGDRRRAGEGASAEAVLIVLGDQPQIEESSARSVCEAFRKTKSKLIVPSYQMRRGHPWLAARPLWEEILNMREPETMRDFLNRHSNEIHYVECDTPSILQDVDTPEDYLKHKPPV